MSTTSCPGRPDLIGIDVPIGMYHCEYCGNMELAGLPHSTDEQVKEMGGVPYGDQDLQGV